MARPFSLRLRVVRTAALVLATGGWGCVGQIAAPGASTGGSGAGGVSGAVNDGLAVVAACTVDAPHPRRLLRLSNAELLTTLRAIAPIADGAVPVGFAVPSVGEKPDDGLSVSRAFHESADALASRLADDVAGGSSALGALDCPTAEFGVNGPCTTAFLTRAAARFFRGISRSDDVASLAALARSIAVRSGGAKALRSAVRAMALSPRSLYLSEGFDLAPDADPARPTAMSAAEMASFLSYRIRGGPPTETLRAALEAALASGTPTPDAMRALIATTFGAADLQRAATTFYEALLDVGGIAALSLDPAKHPEADAAFLLALQRETHQQISAALQPGATLRRVLTTDLQVASAGDAQSGDFARFGRPGLFTLPGVLAGVSSVDHTDIPRRGRFLLRQLFCEPVPTPPANLLTMLPPLPDSASERQRFEKVEMEAKCAGCHQRVNHLGFALEPWDELGRVRAVDEKGNPIDAASTHQVAGVGALSFSGARDLFEQAAAHPLAQSCLAVQGFRHFARRLERGPAGASDACLIRALTDSGRQNGFDLIELFTDTLVRTVLAKHAT